MKISLNHAAVCVDGQGIEYSTVPVPNHSIQVETKYSSVDPYAIEGTFTARSHNYDLESYISITERKFRLSNLLNHANR